MIIQEQQTENAAQSIFTPQKSRLECTLRILKKTARSQSRPLHLVRYDVGNDCQDCDCVYDVGYLFDRPVGLIFYQGKNGKATLERRINAIWHADHDVIVLYGSGGHHCWDIG